MAHAEEGWYAEVGGVSHHFNQRADGRSWNQRNWGLGVQHVTPGTLYGNQVDWFKTAGIIKNSEFDLTTYLGGGLRREIFGGSWGHLSIGLFGGVMTYPSRYNPGNDGKIFPVVLPSVSICTKIGAVCIDGTYIPKVQSNNQNASAALLLQARFKMF